MPLNIRSEEVNRLAEALAVRTRTSKTEAVRLALVGELHRLDEAVPLHEKIDAIRKRIIAHGTTGLEADKAFYDSLCGEN